MGICGAKTKNDTKIENKNNSENNQVLNQSDVLQENEIQKQNDDDKQQNRKINKRILDFHGVQDDDETIYEAVTKVPDKKMSYSDVAFIIESLKSHFFFTNQSEDELEKVISKMFYATADEGTYLFKQGGKASCYFIVDKGGVNLEINGKFVKKIPEGVGFGEQALLYNAPRSGSCQL